MRKLLFFLSVFFLSSPLWATCLVVTPAGSGAKTGTDWNNSLAGSTLETGTLVRGVIYYLADGTYAPVSQYTADSGVLTITIRKAKATDNCTATGWNTSTMGSAQAVFPNAGPGTGAFGLAADYWVIDGNGSSTSQGCGGGPGSTVTSSPPTPSDCGIKIDNSTCVSTTANACNNPVYLSNPGTSQGLLGVSFRYVEIEGNGNNLTEAMIVWNPYGGTNTGSTWNHIYIHNAGCVDWQDGLDGITVTNSYSWGTEISGDTGGCHGQAFFSAGSDSNGLMENNIFRDITGTAIWTFANASTTHNNWKFLSNVVFNSSPAAPWAPYLSDGVIACINTGTNCTNFYFMQNTVVNENEPGINNENTGSYTVENNLYYGYNAPSFNVGTGGTYTQSHNSCLNLNSGSCPSGTANVTDNSAPNPFVNVTASNFNLVSENADWDNRVVTSLDPLTDPNGTSISTDRGAYQFVSGPPPPASVVVTVVVTQ